MTKRPNKLGRIEAEPKEPVHIPWKTILTLLLVVGLVGAGIAGTLGYQNFIASVKAEGVQEFKVSDCEQFSNDKNVKWLECKV